MVPIAVDVFLLGFDGNGAFGYRLSAGKLDDLLATAGSESFCPTVWDRRRQASVCYMVNYELQTMGDDTQVDDIIYTSVLLITVYFLFFSFIYFLYIPFLFPLFLLSAKLTYLQEAGGAYPLRFKTCINLLHFASVYDWLGNDGISTFCSVEFDGHA